MKNISRLLMFVVFLSGCKEQTAELLFDNNDLSDLTVFSYKYDSLRKVSQTEIYYTLLCGAPVDTMITKTKYFYNNKNLLFKSEEFIDQDEKPIIRYYYYNSLDSLIRDLTIESNGDTLYWYEYDYFPDGRKTVYERRFDLRIDHNKEFSEAIKEMKNDTIIRKNKYTYQNNKCQTLMQFDKKNKLIELIEYEYRKGDLFKSSRFIFIDSMKTLKETTFFNYSKSDTKPDTYTLNIFNDTIDKIYYEFEKGIIKSSSIYLDFGEYFTKTNYENGKEINCTIIFSKDNSVKYENYYYNKKKDLIRIKSRRSKLNAH